MASGADMQVGQVKHVYIVDDDAGVRTTLYELVRELGYDARSFATRRDFLDEAETVPVGCVLLDLAMPELSGMDVLRAINDAVPRFRTIMISGHSDIPNAVQALQLGARDFITKPIALVDLEEALTAVFTELQRDIARIERQAAARKLSKD